MMKLLFGILFAVVILESEAGRSVENILRFIGIVVGKYDSKCVDEIKTKMLEIRGYPKIWIKLYSTCEYTLFEDPSKKAACIFVVQYAYKFHKWIVAKFNSNEADKFLNDVAKIPPSVDDVKTEDKYNRIKHNPKIWIKIIDTCYPAKEEYIIGSTAMTHPGCTYIDENRKALEKWITDSQGETVMPRVASIVVRWNQIALMEIKEQFGDDIKKNCKLISERCQQDKKGALFPCQYLETHRDVLC